MLLKKNFFYEDAAAKVLAYVRWNDSGDHVVVVANFSDDFLSEYRISDFPKARQALGTSGHGTTILKPKTIVWCWI